MARPERNRAAFSALGSAHCLHHGITLEAQPVE